MNYKTEIYPYKKQSEFKNRTTFLMDDDMNSKIEEICFDCGKSKGAVVRTLLDYAIKHTKIIGQEQSPCCGNCIHYMPDDMKNYVCCNVASKNYARFRTQYSFCEKHQRR